MTCSRICSGIFSVFLFFFKSAFFHDPAASQDENHGVSAFSLKKRPGLVRDLRTSRRRGGSGDQEGAPVQLGSAWYVWWLVGFLFKQGKGKGCFLG